MKISCADCGCIVDSGVRVVSCGKENCCCHLPERKSRFRVTHDRLADKRHRRLDGFSLGITGMLRGCQAGSELR